MKSIVKSHLEMDQKMEIDKICIPFEGRTFFQTRKTIRQMIWEGKPERIGENADRVGNYNGGKRFKV